MRVLIVDDESLAREGLRRLVETLGHEVTGEAASGPEAIEMLRDQDIDLLLLDIQMPGMDGFEVVANLDSPPAVIFVTAYDQYALRAFEVHALDYLLKPVDAQRFEDAMNRASLKVAQGDSDRFRVERMIDDLLKRQTMSDRVLIKGEGRMYFVKCEDIQWVEAAGNYLRIYTDGQRHLIRETMSRFESRMDPRSFLRIHRSTLVNLDFVAEIRSLLTGDYSVVLESGKELKLSRSYREKLQRAIEDGV